MKSLVKGGFGTAGWQLLVSHMTEAAPSHAPDAGDRKRRRRRSRRRSRGRSRSRRRRRSGSLASSRSMRPPRQDGSEIPGSVSGMLLQRIQSELDSLLTEMPGGGNLLQASRVVLYFQQVIRPKHGMAWGRDRRELLTLGVVMDRLREPRPPTSWR